MTRVPPSRRLLWLAAAVATLGGCALARFDPEEPRWGPTLPAAAQTLDAEVHRMIRLRGVARRDGYVYAMDVAPLMLYAAQRGDAALYGQLLPHASPLIWQRPDDPLTQGFVLWRQKAGAAPEVSGAAEMLWMARALWAGSRAFNRLEDRRLALKIVDGYAKHAEEVDGRWIVRKYFAFGGRTFARHSVLSAYSPDFLAELEQALPDRAWSGFAARSYELLGRARSPSGLLLPVLQPEMATIFPDLGLDIYAPNGIVSLADSCEAAEGALRGRPRLARAVLNVIDDGDAWNEDLPFAYFNADSGEPIGTQSLSTTGYACLARLAAALDDDGARDDLEPWLRKATHELASLPLAQEAPLYMAGPLLLTAQALGAFSR